MKRTLLTIILLTIGSVTFAQWTTGSGNTYITGGNVGIGTASPSVPLEVAGKIRSIPLNSAAGMLEATGVAGNVYFTTNTTSGNGYVNINNSVGTTSVALSSSGNSYFAGGSLGIGTTNPQAKLHVVGGEIRLAGAGTSGIASSAALTFYDSNNTTRYGWVGDGSSGNSDIYLFADAGSSLRFATNGVNDRMFINTSGNVGIGTITPWKNLHVVGVVASTTTDFSPANTGSAIFWGQNSTTGNIYSLIQASINGSISPGILSLNPNGGSVGIGTANPGSYRLAVNGGIHSQSVNVDMTGWSDYVFNQSYSLPSLMEVKTYIDQNHHLPDMPSEQEVIKDGINLGEMNKLLTKKVEELTLYLIEKDKKEADQQVQISLEKKQLESQQAEIDELKSQMKALLEKSK